MIRARAVIDLGAIERNCAELCGRLTGDATLCAVVKADGYGHGMVRSGEAALRGGAALLGVAAATEAAELRDGLPEARVFTMGVLSADELEVALDARAEIGLWDERFRRLVASRAEAHGRACRVHVKYDTGMGRLGESDPELVLALCEAVHADPRLDLTGLWTHLATADEDDPAFMHEQLARFGAIADHARDRFPGVCVHAANSAATLRETAAHFDMVRCGVAIYGLDPFGRDPADQLLRPALSLRSYVAETKPFKQGWSAGYGRQWRAPRDTVVAILPIGYGDGWRRGLTNAADALIDGKRYPIVGTVSMDNVTVDLGPDPAVRPGAEAVLIGRQEDERILAEDLARTLGTINYEITCGISPRVPREYLGALP
ncbi:MAG: alanine racemase [Actinomycetota bacterium]|nr:alanine racemase [Actinomycetota bacterium]